MKVKDIFDPKLPKDLQKRYLISTFLQTSEHPTIEMKLIKDVVQATVKFNFKYLKRDITKSRIQSGRIPNSDYTRIIDGPSEDVYKLAAKQASRISLSLGQKFNDAWQKTLMQILNTPSKNKSILNLGVYQNKKESFGIYDITSPSVLLQKQLTRNGMTQQVLAALSKVDETTLWRHLKGTYEISREAAIKYAKALGCDPAEILFNDLNIPVWGTADTIDDGYGKGYSVYPGEILELEKTEMVKCPRETYRPDVKAIKINNGGQMYDNHTAFYYDNPTDEVENKICIVGTKLKNFKDDQVRLRYFIGVVEKIKNKKTINILNIDPFNSAVDGIEEDEDLHGFQALQDWQDDNRYLIKDIVPEFISPVVSFVDNDIDQEAKSEIIKAYDTYYTASRKDELAKIDEFRKEKIRAAIKGKIAQSLKDFHEHNEYYDNDSPIEFEASEKLKVLMNSDERFRGLLTKIGTGKYKTEKEMKSAPLTELEDLSKNLTTKENEIAEAAYLEFEEDMLHLEALNQPMDGR